jgi:molecular chaperone GrpE
MSNEGEYSESGPNGAGREGAEPGTLPSPDSQLADRDRLAALEEELGQMRERWMRSEAEIANLRVRAKRDVDETRLYAVQKFAADVVEAAENLGRGLNSLPPASTGEPENIARLRSGLAGVERSFVGMLERNGIKRENPTGAAFDPNLHQAMGEQEASGHPPGTVLNALTQVWTLNGRLLRPAMVVVAKATNSEASAGSFRRDRTV